MMRLWWLITQTQSSSSMPSSSAWKRFMYSRLLVWIWRSHAFCEPQEWYIAIGRWVMAKNGYLSSPPS